MKVLIVGKNSYIAQRTGAWFEKKPVPAEVEYISVRDDSWRQKNLTGFDAVIYTAAIVHRRDAVPEEVYDAVNAEQPFAFAQAAKAALKLVQGNALVNKLFGGVSYAEDYAKCPLGDYQLVEFRDAIKEWFE